MPKIADALTNSIKKNQYFSLRKKNGRSARVLFDRKEHQILFCKLITYIYINLLFFLTSYIVTIATGRQLVYPVAMDGKP